ncbi:MAG TPA: ABC transporter substrate-binding protein [Actinomycetota bacterium]|nr:ABC transporter substrate-binding protein [Actinomycetota bacterium]
MKNRRWVVGATAVIAATFMVVPTAFAQSSSPSSGQSQASRTFTIGVLEDLNTINPIRALSGSEYEYLNLNYDLAIQFSPKDLSPYPGLVTDWSHSSDGLTWTYKVRTDVQWQDGQPLTAKDIAFTYEFMVKNDISAFSNYFPFTTSVTAPDDTTVIWKTTKPTMAPQFPPWVYILPEHIWGKFDKNEAKNYEHIPVVGSGVFQLVQWKKGQFWKFRYNPNYWQGVPYIHTLIFQKFDNAEAMVTALKNGEIDFAEDIPPDLYATLQGQQGIGTHASVPATFAQMSFNMTPNGQPAPTCNSCGESTAHPALQDPTVREAVEMAVDKQTLIDKVLRGYGEVGTTIVPIAFSQWHWSPPGDEQIPFDIAGANQLLDQAGYKDTDGDGIRNMPGGGEDLSFRFYVLSSEPTEIKAAPFIKGWLKQIGIEIKPQTLSEGKLIDDWYANDYDMYMWGWGPDPDPDFILSTFTTSQCESWSDTCFSDPRYDKLYTEQRTQIDPTERKQTIEQMEQIIYQKIPEVVLWYTETLQAYRSDRWTGFVPQPQPGGYLLFAYSPYSYYNLRPIGAGGAASGGVSGFAWLAIAVGILLVVGAILFSRRRSEEARA